MREKIHMCKQELDDIPVPMEKLDAIISRTVQDAARKRKPSWQKKVMYGSGAAVFAVGLLLGSSAVSPAMASFVAKIPIVGSIFSESGDIGLKKASEQGLITVVGKPQVVDGTSLTIDEIFYDGTRFSIGYSLKSEKPLGEMYLRPELSINGEKAGFTGSSKEDQKSSTYRTGILEFNSPQKLPKEFTLGLAFDTEDGKRWNFSLPVSTLNPVMPVPINHKQQVGGIDLTVSDLKIGPAGMRLTFQAVSKEANHLAAYLEFKVVDEKGNEIVSHSGGSEGKIVDGKEHMTGSRVFDPLSADVKKLTITPYLKLPSGGGGVAFDENGNETAINDMPKHGDEIEFSSFTVTLP